MIISVVALLLIVLLAIPVTLHIRVYGMRDFQCRCEVVWLYDYIRFALPTNKSGNKTKLANTSKPEAENGKPGSRQKSRSGALLLNGDVRKQLILYFHSLIKHIQISNLYLRARVGLGDPADTGLLWAQLWPVSVVLASLQRATIHIEPDLVDNNLVLDLDGRANLQFVPLKILYITGAMLLSKPILNTFAQR